MVNPEGNGLVGESRDGFGKGKLGPAQVLVVGFIAVILIGTGLLMLPISTHSPYGTSFIDALFTATSAVCVTGLVVVNTLEHWTIFGKIIILICIQIGGLGFMTLVSMTFILLGRRITLKNRLVMQEALNFKTPAGVIRFTKTILKLTLLIEAIGALLLSLVFVPQFGLLDGIGVAIFHSVSAFCNAGFDIIGPSSLTDYVDNPIVNITIMILIVAGGLGYTVWIDSYEVLKLKLKSPDHFTWKQAFYKLALHTKLVWILTGLLIFGGFLFLYLVEHNNPHTLGNLSFSGKIYAAMFQSISPRTAGFNTIPLDELKEASQALIIGLMFIGGSPAGTAGGVKTVTIGILLLCGISVIQGNTETVVFRKTIAIDSILRALTVIIIAMVIVSSSLMILTLTESGTFMEILFETVSAFGTAGLTLGITSSLSAVGKIIIICLMFIGRVGLITIGVALMIKQGKNTLGIRYPEEKILVG
ncbi:MAG: Trk family potassium uptake protein [Epulopiscium sp. Nele67-Bin005]|nr:MAG: Trk family potassium uptake protein [Epulopiscium sp. Nele67-Bin005]